MSECIDVEYARLLRRGTWLGLLDPALLEAIFCQYELGLAAARFLPCDDAGVVQVVGAKRHICSNWMGPPYWDVLSVDGANWSLGMIADIARLCWMGPDRIIGHYSWTIPHYRAIMLASDTDCSQIRWYSADKRLVAQHRLPVGVWRFAGNGLVSNLGPYKLQFAEPSECSPAGCILV